MYIVPGDKYVKPKVHGFLTKIMSLPAPTQRKLERIFETGINNLNPSKSSKLVWTTFGAMFGDGSRIPAADYKWVWDLGHSLWGDLFVQQGLGGYFYYRLSLRTDNIWLVYFKDMGTLDVHTGKPITIATYWIDNNYVPPPGSQAPSSRKTLANKSDVDKLRDSWGSRKFYKQRAQGAVSREFLESALRFSRGVND